MKGHKSGVKTQILAKNERALFVHCYAHSLNLAVGDTLKQISCFKDGLCMCNEIIDLIKKSPKHVQFYESSKRLLLYLLSIILELTEKIYLTFFTILKLYSCACLKNWVSKSSWHILQLSTVEEHYKAIFVKSFNLVLECNSERQVWTIWFGYVFKFTRPIVVSCKWKRL